MTENKNRTDFIIASDIAKKDNFELVWDIEEYNDKLNKLVLKFKVIIMKYGFMTIKERRLKTQQFYNFIILYFLFSF